jgi:hypothetical protein
MLGGHLDEDELEPVRVAATHLEQTPRLTFGLGVDDDAALGEEPPRLGDVAHLEKDTHRLRMALLRRA